MKRQHLTVQISPRAMEWLLNFSGIHFFLIQDYFISFKLKNHKFHTIKDTSKRINNRSIKITIKGG